MRSIFRLLAVSGAIVALTLLAPATLADTPKAFHLDKTCAEDLSEPLGYICTVQHSDFKWIPAGTDIRYLSQTDNVVDAAFRSTTAVRLAPAPGVATSMRSASSTPAPGD